MPDKWCVNCTSLMSRSFEVCPYCGGRSFRTRRRTIPASTRTWVQALDDLQKVWAKEREEERWQPSK